MWSDVAVTLLAPGARAWRRQRWVSLALLVGGVGVPALLIAYVVVAGRSWLALSLDVTFLTWLVVVLVIAAACRMLAVAEVWRVRRAQDDGPNRSGRDRWAWLLVAAVCLPMIGGAVQIGRARAAIAPAFTPTAGGPLFDRSAPTASTATSSIAPRSTTASAAATTLPVIVPDPLVDIGVVTSTSTPPTTTTTTTTLPPKPERPRSGIEPEALADVTTVLLLGGDAGPGRYGLRTDTMMLFSLHRPSGRAALISIPRNLERLLFPPGGEMERRYPYGFTDLANAVYPIVSARPDLRQDYDDVDGVRPGVVAIAHGIGYSLDVTIDDYVLLDMQGFLEVIDALGGVTVDVPVAVPMPGNVPGAPTQYPDEIGPGRITMDGTTALGYVRSRKGDTDYHRTGRQRDLLEALATQVSFDDVALSFGAVSRAVGGTLRTSLTPDELAETLAVIGGETAIVESVGLVPPLVNVRRPDYERLARIVGEVRLALATGRPSGW